MKRSHLFLNIILLTACVGAPEIPEGTIPEQQMTELLVDFHLLEAKIEQLGVKPDSAKKVYSHFADQLYKKYDVDSAQYQKSLLFYLDNPEIMHDIYEVVVDSLMLRDRAKRID